MCSNIMITKESLSSFDMISDTINFLKKKTEKQLNKAKFRRNKIVKLNKNVLIFSMLSFHIKKSGIPRF